MKGIKLFCIVVGVYLLQTVLIQEITFLGISPNLFLVVTCGISFLFGSTTGGVCGLIFGLLQDMNIGRMIGLNAFLLMHIGIIMGQFNKRFFKDNYVVAVIFIVLSTMVYELIVYILGAFIYSQDIMFGTLTVKILIRAFLNAITGIIVYPILLKINIGVEVDRRIFGGR